MEAVNRLRRIIRHGFQHSLVAIFVLIALGGLRAAPANAACEHGAPDGILDAGEECDDGNLGYYDACLPTCVNNVCGDGYTNTGVEDCDTGGTDTAACDAADCTTAVCGDGYQNTAGEVCDDGNTISGDGCTASCDAIEDCGDGIVQAGLGEECDDGNAINTDSCANCQNAKCGDGFVQAGEECDDGNAIDTDGCISTCQNAKCGDGFVQAGVEGCDDGNTNNADFCTYPGCAPATCGDGIVQTENGEECDIGPSQCDGGANAGADCALDSDCPGECVGGADVGDACTADVQCHGICGAPNPGFPCTLATELDDCGQPGACNLAGVSCDLSGATCDNSGNNDVHANACRSNCLKASCGDGVIDAGENCDGGVAGTSGSCVISNQGGPPSSVAPLNCRLAECGDGVVCSDSSCSTGPGGDAEECDDGADGIDSNDCLDDCASARCGDGFVETGVEECDQGDGVNSDTLADRCRLDCVAAGCGDGVVDTPENCDTSGESATCDADCTFVGCGDGTLNESAGEQCDFGDTDDGDGCSSTCILEGCGDGIINNNGNEECDDGGESVLCDANCSFADCGDGDLNQTRGEECDDGNAESLDGCDIACQDEFCGDGIVNDAGAEECEPPVGDGPDQCRSNCKSPYCGDAITDIGSGETCDDGGESASCDDDCTAAACPDGNENEAAGEECDPGVLSTLPDACRPGCKDPACGDLIIDPGHGEQCDSLIATNCTVDCCATGAVASSYNTGLAGMDCQLSHLDAKCDTDICLRSKRIGKKVARMMRGLEKSVALAGDGRTGRAEKSVRGIRNRAGSLLKNLFRLCPDDADADDEAATRTCMDAELDAVTTIAIETEQNLALNNP
jgi:cysteine-rich repeat protein